MPNNRISPHLGATLHSIGAQSTAGTARLLYDYPAAEQTEILDLLFKPAHGAALHHLKVEIGGDAQISCGAEASPIRGKNGTDTDFNRGCERGRERWPFRSIGQKKLIKKQDTSLAPLVPPPPPLPPHPSPVLRALSLSLSSSIAPLSLHLLHPRHTTWQTSTG